MKSLILLRHAKSGWDDPELRDFDRPLNDKGIRAAITMGRRAAAEGISPDRLVASPAVRVVQTLEGFGEGLGLPLRPLWDRRIYLASAANLLDIIHETGPETGTLMLAGHNPGLEDLILDLVADDGTSPLREQVEVKFPTASLARLIWEGDDWASLGSKSGARLDVLIRPRDVDASLGPDFD
ncbi:MAG: histidine phosphatase family protein [Sphingobium sp.]|nr:histidine phosphatase family protein [Sphingobium sp.]MBP6111090.1 histidine phosphatase family protein [Sphingobium sp.]MBP8670932.1 histidine phosphatase family protein [Sphingobium sp.]MBP9157953.1 histidine phosphatase family protein [Sphingobium sp.]MCC6482038.1 histidine phosphatase family protein [Sphingomonadaceae bacterium]